MLRDQVEKLHRQYLAMSRSRQSAHEPDSRRDDTSRGLRRPPRSRRIARWQRKPSSRTQPVAETAPLVFEQPLNERMRTFLRLDFLYSQALYHNEMQSQWGSRAAMGSLLDILAIADARRRARRRAEGTRAASRAAQRVPEQARASTPARLRTVMSNLLRLRADLVACGSNYLRRAARIRSSCRRSSIAAPFPAAPASSTCRISSSGSTRRPTPRARSFNEWLASLRPLCDAIAELLWITRQHGKPRQEIARGGVYHITFERDTPIQLVRIALPQNCGLYPETSGSHYRCSVRLLAWNGLQARPVQTTEDVPFTLTCCT